ncbi:MAG: ABC transporter permease [Mycoplasmoidaceae bacterium]
MNSNKTVFQMKLHNKWQKFMHSDVRQSTTKKILATVCSILLAFFIALVIACSVCGTWKSFGKIFSTIFTSGFQNETFFNSLLSNMAILIVGGLSFIAAYKAGLFNIGISGQMVAGATGATIICHLSKLGTGANQFVIVLVSMLLGALFASLVGAMKAFLRINEVVSSIMLNWIIYFMSILTLSSLPIPTDTSQLNTLAPDDSLLLRMDGQSWIPLLILAGITIIFVAVILNLTVFGKKQKVVGLSNTGALAAGYNVKANQIASMAISGAIAGILGVMLYCGYSPNMPVTAAAKVIPQEGFNGISVGLISMCNPFASIPVSLFFSMVKTSISDLQVLGIDNHIGDVVFGIVVYGAAAITLFLNIKPYWLTLDIFRGKNFSKIKHERNMSYIELLSLSSDQCAILHKYYIFYVKQQTVKSTFKLSPIIKSKMRLGSFRYWCVQKQAQYRIWRNLEYDLVTGDKYFKQTMVHLVKDKKTNLLMADLEHKFRKGWYIRVTDEILADRKLKSKIKEVVKCNISEGLWQQLRKANEDFKAKPFNDNNIRMTAKLAYLQNLRSGLQYRNTISKQNKLTYFTLLQTKQQAESIGLGEIRSKKQYNFAHSAYLKAYQKTFEIVKAHYDTMVKTFTRDKALNIMGIRFNSATLEQLFMANLKSEIKAISHLINCPLSKAQLATVGSLVSKTRYLDSRIVAGTNEANSLRTSAQPYFDKSKRLNEKAVRLHAQLKANTKIINRVIDCPVKDIEVKELKELIARSDSLSQIIDETRTQSADAKAMAEEYIIRSKDVMDSVTTDKIARDQASKKIESIVDRARLTEKATQSDKWTAQRIANEKADKELRRIAIRQARKAALRNKLKGGE